MAHRLMRPSVKFVSVRISNAYQATDCTLMTFQTRQTHGRISPEAENSKLLVFFSSFSLCPSIDIRITDIIHNNNDNSHDYEERSECHVQASILSSLIIDENDKVITPVARSEGSLHGEARIGQLWLNADSALSVREAVTRNAMRDSIRFRTTMWFDKQSKEMHGDCQFFLSTDR